MSEPIAPTPTTSRGARFVRALALRLALLGFGLIVALLFVELAVRLLSDEGPTSTFRDAEIGRRFTRSWEGDAYVEEAGRAVHLHFNREGMRDRDWPEARSPSALRVAVLGDSMVAALATDTAKRFTDLGGVSSIQALVPGLHMDFLEGEGAWTSIEVQNWGVPGSSPALAVRLFETRARRFDPQVAVLVWFVGNDLSDDWQPLGGRRAVAADLDEAGALRWLPYAKPSSPASEWLARSSHLYVWHKRMLARVESPAEGATLRPGLRALDASEATPVRDAWRMAEQVLLYFAARARAAAAQPVLLVLPCAEQVYDDLWERTVAAAAPLGWRLERDLAGRRLAEIAQRVAMPCVDVGRTLLAGRPGLKVAREADWIFLNGTGHLNDKGHDLVRAGLKRAIVEAYLDQPITEPHEPPK